MANREFRVMDKIEEEETNNGSLTLDRGNWNWNGRWCFPVAEVSRCSTSIQLWLTGRQVFEQSDWIVSRSLPKPVALICDIIQCSCYFFHYMKNDEGSEYLTDFDCRQRKQGSSRNEAFPPELYPPMEWVTSISSDYFRYLGHRSCQRVHKSRFGRRKRRSSSTRSSSSKRCIVPSLRNTRNIKTLKSIVEHGSFAIKSRTI